MSSTGRSNAREEHAMDYYVTPKEVVEKAMEFIFGKEGIRGKYCLDPAAGGNPETEDLEEFPAVYADWMEGRGGIVDSIDIREDSKAKKIGNFMEIEPQPKYDVIATNPPFSMAEEFVERCMQWLKPGGVLVLMERMNFICSEKRRKLFEQYPLNSLVVHRNRVKFLTNQKDRKKRSQTDSTEYAHFVWVKGEKPLYIKTFVI